MDNQYSPLQSVNVYIEAAAGKTKTPSWKLVLMGVISGICIALGAGGSAVAAHNIADVGVSRALMGTVFPVGLMMVVLLGAELFTGDCLMIMGVLDKRYSVPAMLRVLLLVYIGNFVGSFAAAALICASGQLDYSGGLLGAYTIKTAYTKAGISFGKAFISGILCNILVCSAVVMAVGTKNTIGKLFSCFFPIFLFVVSGYEHCVANMYYISAGILAARNADYAALAAQTYGITPEQLEATLNWKHFLIDNLLPVTAGNIIGGMLLVGVVLYVYYKSGGNQKTESGMKKA